MSNKIEIYKSGDSSEIKVQFDNDTVWLNQYQLTELFQTDRTSILKHIQNIYSTNELDKKSTCAKFAQVRLEGERRVTRRILHYNLDMIISVGYRVNSKRGVQFRQWATQRLKDYLVKGYAINEKRLAQKQQEVQYLKTGLRILGRAIEEQIDNSNNEMLKLFAKGLELLDDYDHEQLDLNGDTKGKTVYPEFDDYMALINEMYSEFKSDVFAKPKDESFNSSIGQIKQSFGNKELYPSLEEKAANLLYLIVKNHSFVDGNKRIAAACFLLFLDQNNILRKNGELLINNDALAALTLFIASSRSEEADTVKRLIISILNRNK